MKQTALLLLAFLLPPGLYSAVRTTDEAAAIATAFVQRGQRINSRQAPTAPTLTYAATWHKTNSEEAALYVFNITDGGFILVSADTRSNAVLGYTDRHEYNEQELPDNLRFWLQTYAEQLSAREGTQPAQMPNIQAVEPLLDKENIRWDQDEPFNLQCPKVGNQNCVTGCVSTAFGQIMRYYRYPAQGKGSASYQWNGQTLSSDFSQHTYQWDLMKGDYFTDPYTDEQANAVALLMADLGVAFQVRYSTNSSSASAIPAAKALIDYFGYDNNLQIRTMDIHGEKNFAKDICSELQASRPVLFSGRTESNSGHSFVCDGIDENGLLHINWGWSGYYNGYFALTALTPYGQGIGGGAVGEGFNNNVSALIGIQPDKGNAAHPQLNMTGWSMTNKTAIRRTEGVYLIFNQLNNYGYHTWTGYIGAVICNTNQQMLTPLVTSSNTLTLGSYYYYQTLNIQKGTIPSSLEPGQYVVMPIYTPSPTADWTYVDGVDGKYCTYNLTLTADSAFFSLPVEEPSEYLSNLTVTDNGDETATFSWEAATVSPYYVIEVLTDDNARFSKDTVTATQGIVRFYLNGKRQYNWTVYALDDNRQTLDKAKGTTFIMTVNTNYQPTNLSCVAVSSGLTFSWEGDAPAYQLEVKQSGVVLYRNSIIGNTCSLPLSSKGTYDWTVRAINALQTIYISEAATAQYVYNNEAGNTTYLKNLAYNNLDEETIVFTWEGDIEVPYYAITVYSGSVTMAQDTITSKEYTLHFCYPGTFNYSWYVEALDEQYTSLQKQTGTSFALTITAHFNATNLTEEITTDGVLFYWEGDATDYVISVGWGNNVYYQDFVTGNTHLLTGSLPTNTEISWSLLPVDPTHSVIIGESVSASFIYKPTPTDCHEVEAHNDNDGKFILNGQLIIRHNSQLYNLLGQPL
ncbi:MAG: C10 family peptidase [Paludibacteraceae bacterium]|nr:C10 family peptidase [Paludibacteraceae bacterium]